MDHLVLEYIKEQPTSLRNVYNHVFHKLSGLKAQLPSLTNVHFVASGSSLNASYAARFYWESLVCPTHVWDPLEFTLRMEKGLISSDSTIIAVSQSGQSSAAIDAAKTAREMGLTTIGVTAGEASPLANATQYFVLVDCGEELVGPKTKGYSATIASLAFLARLLSNNQLDEAGLESALENTDSYLKQGELVHQLAIRFKDADFSFMIGSGSNHGTAREAALKIMEIAKFPSAFLDVEDSLHGPLTSLTSKSFVVVFGGECAVGQRIPGVLTILEEIGVRGFYISSGQIIPIGENLQSRGIAVSDADPISDIVPVQLFAYYLALERNVSPTKFTYDRNVVRAITKKM